MNARLALAAAAALSLALPSAAAAQFAATTADGSAAVVKTKFALVPEDVNGTVDAYARVDGVPKLLTHGTGTDAGTYLQRASGDGSIAFFRTSDALVAADTDATDDLYVRRPGGIALVAPQATSAVDVVDMTADGARVFLRSSSALVPQDVDAKLDIYEYKTDVGALALRTHATAEDVAFGDIDPGGGGLVFSTAEQLDKGDTDTMRDVYYQGGLVVGMLSAGDGPHAANFRALGSANGRALFATAEKLRPEDTDDRVDLYEASAGGFLALRTPSPNPAAQAQDVEFAAAAKADVGRVIFSTTEKLVAGDTDATRDYYAHDAGKLTLLTPGVSEPVYEDVSDDAEVLLFSTPDQLLATDTDQRMDMYRSGDAGPVHVAKTNAPYDQFEGALSPSGALTAWETSEPIAADDKDTLSDGYLRGPSGIVFLASKRDAGAVGGGQQHAEVADFLTTDELILVTTERLLGEDRNDVVDVYASWGAKLTMASRDASAPDTLMSAPSQVGEHEAFAISLGATEQAALECRVDGHAWTACAPGWKPGGLAAGVHTLESRATDVAGNADATPAKATVTVTGPAPDVADLPGQPARPPVLPAADEVAPVMSKAKVLVRRRIPTLTYALTERASVKVRVQRRSGGRWTALRTKTLAGRAGANRAALPKLPRRATVRLLLTAADAAGNASAKLVLRPTGR